MSDVQLARLGGLPRPQNKIHNEIPATVAGTAEGD
jgi:hypothetical protein